MKGIIQQKILLLWGILLLTCVNLSAQNQMHVSSFKEVQSDVLDPSRSGKKDRNGKTCSLIKVVTTQRGFSFDIGSSLEVEAVEQKVAEIWVFVPVGTAKIKITHPQLGQLDEADGYYWLPSPTKEATSYRLVLEAGKVHSIVESVVTQQYLQVRVIPKDAALEINGQPWVLDENGAAEKYVDFGEYNYRATAPMYHPGVGMVTVNDPNEPHKLYINLKPQYGFLQVDAATADMVGATVYVDGERVGTVPVTNRRLESGMHKLRLIKELYKPYEQSITISDSVTLKIAPRLDPNFAVTHLSVANNAEIWINGEKRGNGTWSGPLESGTYRFETKLLNHRSVVQTEVIREESQERRITLRAPEPIYGSINITSQPSGAVVYVDGKEMGTTPRVLRNVLIGSRKVEVKMRNFSSFERVVKVEEGQTANVKATLSNVARIRITTDQYSKYSRIWMDGKLLGTSPYEIEVPCGMHEFVAEYDGYKYNDWRGKTTVNVSNKTPIVTILMKKLPRNYVKKKHFYIEGDYQLGGFSGYGGALGFYINNFNVEAGFLMGNSETELNWFETNGGYENTYYTAMRIHLKGGYGIRCGRRIQLTPQVGLGYVSITDDESYYEKLSKTYAVQWIGSLRMTYALWSWLQLVVVPEYTGTINEGPLFEKASAVSDDMKGLGSGFNIKAGFSLYF